MSRRRRTRRGGAGDQEARVQGGITLKPGTPVERILPALDEVDVVLIMTVEPGFGGQKFMPDMLPKAREIRKRLKPHQRLEMDGGIAPRHDPAARRSRRRLVCRRLRHLRTSRPRRRNSGIAGEKCGRKAETEARRRQRRTREGWRETPSKTKNNPDFLSSSLFHFVPPFHVFASTLQLGGHDDRAV